MSQMTLPSGEVIDVFGAGGTELTARQFGLQFLGSIDLDPAVREGGDRGLPAALGNDSKRAQEFAAIAKRIEQRAIEIGAKTTDVMEIT